MSTDSPGRTLILGASAVLFCACGGLRANGVKVIRNPYAHVDWSSDRALKAQLHEHVGDGPAPLQRMDDAGYDIVPLMQYSGVTSRRIAWHERHWPPERFLPEGFQSKLKHIKLFYPSAEEVGFMHLLSPFLTTYIAKWDPKSHERRESWHYSSTQQAIDLIRSHGGLPFIAHPWKEPKHYAHLHGFSGMELYNAYCRNAFQIGKTRRDENEKLVRSWDSVLLRDPSIVGIAVNDWFGPGTFGFPGADPRVTADTRDSGKVIVLMKQISLEAFRAALSSGAVLAVKDLGKVKDHFPRVRAINVNEQAIRIEATDPAAEVHWFVDGKALPQHGVELSLSTLTSGSRYARAEIVGRDGSTVYTQAFALGPTKTDTRDRRSSAEAITRAYSRSSPPLLHAGLEPGADRWISSATSMYSRDEGSQQQDARWRGAD